MASTLNLSLLISPIMLFDKSVNIDFSLINKEGEKIKYIPLNPDSPIKFEILFDLIPYRLLIGASLGLSLLQKTIVPTNPS